MSDDLSPEEDVVRRLLAQARHDEPTPPDVVARLDARLAELRAELQAPEAADRSPVTTLDAARTRRRRVPALLAAAAALVVGGVAVSTVLDQSETASDSASAGDAGALEDRDTADELGAEDGAASPEYAEPDPDTRSDAGADAPAEARAVPELSEDDTLRAAVRRLVRASATEERLLLDSGPAWPECATTPLGDGPVVWVLLDDRPGAVVVDRSGGRSVAEVWLCGDASPLRSFAVGSR